MPYIEITDSKFWSFIKEESEETADTEFANKLMKLALKTANHWGEDYIDVVVLKRMKRLADTMLKDLGEI